MLRKSSRLTPRVEALESKLALSTVTVGDAAAAKLSLAEYDAARTQIEDAVAHLDSGNGARADAALAKAVKGVPGGATLLTTLETDLSSAGLKTQAAAVAERHLLVGIFDNTLRVDVNAGSLAIGNKQVAKSVGVTPTFTTTIYNNTNQQLTIAFTQDNVSLTTVSGLNGGNQRSAPIIPMTSDPITITVSGYYNGSIPTTGTYSYVKINPLSGTNFTIKAGN